MVLFCIPCLVLLIYFGVASIFVPRYRVYIKDGWRCFIDKLMRRKCAASFDNRMRLAFSMWLTSHHMPGLGRFFHSERNFKLTFTVIGVAFTILSIYLIFVGIQFYFNPPCANNACAATP